MSAVLDLADFTRQLGLSFGQVLGLNLGLHESEFNFSLARLTLLEITFFFFFSGLS